MGLFSKIGSALGISGDSAFTGAMTIGSGLLSYKGQREANQANIELANTAYQRAMRDMKKAGLNPILAGKLGGAQSPTMLSELGAGVQSAQSAAQTASNVQMQSAQTDLSQEQQDKVKAEIIQIGRQGQLTIQQTAKLYNDTMKVYQEIKKVSAETSSIEMKNILDKMFTDVMGGHEYVWTAHKLNMGPDKLVDLLSNIVMKLLPNKSQTTIMKGK